MLEKKDETCNRKTVKVREGCVCVCVKVKEFKGLAKAWRRHGVCKIVIVAGIERMLLSAMTLMRCN